MHWLKHSLDCGGCTEGGHVTEVEFGTKDCTSSSCKLVALLVWLHSMAKYKYKVGRWAYRKSYISDKEGIGYIVYRTYPTKRAF